jgi:hypothetical protein
MEIADLTTPQIVVLYNSRAEIPVKKFTDRASAEKRLAALMAEKKLTLGTDGKLVGNGEIPPADAKIITVLVQGNPKRWGTPSHVRFAPYKDGMSTDEFLSAGGIKADLRWDAKHGFIQIG